MTPVVGTPAPDLTLVDQFGQVVRLSDFRHEAHVAVVFYPFAFSGICTGELRQIRDHVEEFTDAGVRFAAVSCDPVFSLRAYAEAEAYDFPLLSDFWPHGQAARRYGVFDESAGRAERGSFLVDREGVLRWSVVHPPAQERPLSLYREAVAGLSGS